MSNDSQRSRDAERQRRRIRLRQELFPTFTAINRFVRESLTSGGKAILLVILISLFGLVYLETPLIFLLSSLVSIMVVAGIVSFLYRPQLKCSVLTPETAMFGERVEMEIYLRNTKRRSTYDLTIEARRVPRHFRIRDEDAPFIDEVKRGTTVRAVHPFRVRRRGITRFPRLRVSSSFPFNLFRFRQNVATPGELIVMPRYFPLSAFSFEETSYAQAGRFENAANRAAETDQFLGSREFVPGVPVRRWDYASWARIGKPIVREFQSEQTQLASLFVDTFGEPTHSSRLDDRFEALLSLAASLTHHLDAMQYTIEYLVLGSRNIHRAEIADTGAGLSRQQVFQELALAGRDPESNLAECLAFEESLLPDVSCLFVLLAKWDDQRCEMLRRVNSHRNYVKPILVVGHADELPARLPENIEVVSVSEINAGAVEI